MMNDRIAVKVVQLEIEAEGLTCSFSPDRSRAVTAVQGKTVRSPHRETALRGCGIWRQPVACAS